MRNSGKISKPKNPIKLSDPQYKQRRERTKKARLNRIIEEEAEREIREAKTS